MKKCNKGSATRHPKNIISLVRFDSNRTFFFAITLPPIKPLKTHYSIVFASSALPNHRNKHSPLRHRRSLPW